jgi:hypothetical protein
MPNLQMISVEKTQVTTGGYRRFEERRPDVHSGYFDLAE